MSKGNGMTRGDRRRNARREQLRGMLPRDGAVIGIDLGDEKQALAVVDHDVPVLARKTVRVKAFRLGEALDWAVEQARAKGLTSVTVACEPTGSRWLQVQRLCAERGLRRAALITSGTASQQRVRDFLSVAWPVATEACAHPFRSRTWLAALQVVASRSGGQPEELAVIGRARLSSAISERPCTTGWRGGTRWSSSRT